MTTKSETSAAGEPVAEPLAQQLKAADLAPDEAVLPRRLVRLAAAQADCNEATALRAIAGLPTRGDKGERVLKALRELGVDLDAVPRISGLSATSRIG